VVKDAEGQPLKGTIVQLCLKRIENGRAQILTGLAPIGELQETTAADGRFTFANVPPEASVAFLISKPGFATFFSGRDTQATHHYSYRAGIDNAQLVLPAPAKIQGRVVEAETNLPRAQVRLVVAPDKARPGSALAAEAISREDGTFTIDALDEGTYRVIVAPESIPDDLRARETVLTVGPGETMELVVELEKPAILAASIVDERSGEPIKGADISVVKVFEDGSKEGFVTLLTTDAEGAAKLEMIAADYLVTFVSRDGYKGESPNETLILKPGQTANVTISLVPVEKITGIVTDSGGRPVPGARVEVGPGGFHPGLKSDEEGRFEVPWQERKGDEVRESFVIAQSPGEGLAVRMYVDDATQPVEVRMMPDVTFEGRVVTPEGKPIPYATLTIAFADDEWTPPVDPCVTRGDAEGRYRFKNLPDDTNYIITAEARGFASARLQASPEGAGGTVVELPDAVVRLRDSAIAGKVVDAEKSAVAKAIVKAQADGLMPLSVRTGEDGSFVIDALPKGPVTLMARAPGRLSSEPLVVQAGDDKVTIVVRQPATPQRMMSRRPPQTPSLLGKALGDLSRLAEDFDTQAAAGKRVLVCFFDVNQRSSRHAVSSLGKRAAMLDGRGVAVVVVDLSGDPPETAEKWAAQAQIAFPVGAAGESSAKVREEWAVGGLPWIVLTDSEHVVRAEGLSLTGLEATLDK